MKSWGDVNLVMNRLVREEKILSFRSNAQDAPRTGRLEIRIVPADGEDRDEVRASALRDLARRGIVADVMVE